MRDDWNDMKHATTDSLLPPLVAWLDAVDRTKPEDAFVSLLLFVGHLLSGAAVELGVAETISVEGAIEVIEETMRDQLSLLAMTEGRMQ